MGIIKAFTGATGGTMADQWLEMYYCDSIPQGILAYRGKKRVSERSSNTKGDENVISDGSVIVVNEGQSAVAVEQGKVIGCYRQPGEHVFRGGSASIFSGGGVTGIGKEIAHRIGFGGAWDFHENFSLLGSYVYDMDPCSTKRDAGSTMLPPGDRHIGTVGLAWHYGPVDITLSYGLVFMDSESVYYTHPATRRQDARCRMKATAVRPETQ